MAETKQLNVGDVIYQDDRWNISRITIDRVTPKMAFAGDVKFRREYVDGSGLNDIGFNSKWSRTSYRLETPHLKEKYEIRVLRTKISQVKFSDLPIDKIKSILAIVNEQTEK